MQTADGTNMVIEGIVTTENDDGSMHLAPMGPVVSPDLTQWTLKPFQSSTTFANLRRTNRCVFHVTDDALLLATAAIGKAKVESGHYREQIGWTLNNSCHWYALQVRTWDISEPRSVAVMDVRQIEIQRPFWGWNRAKHAVLEAAILATRVHLLERDFLAAELDRLAIAVDKTAGPREKEAFATLCQFVKGKTGSPPSSEKLL